MIFCSAAIEGGEVTLWVNHAVIPAPERPLLTQ
jgi:hypothetical protein